MDDCIMASGKLMSTGYGRVKHEGQWQLAHRVAWQETYGPIPDGMHVCHHCDNPPCINVEHLFLGTPADNMRDKARKGRGDRPSQRMTHCIHGHEFTDENTRWSIRNGYQVRTCRTCKRLWIQERRDNERSHSARN